MYGPILTSCDQFTARWSPSDGATDYEIQVATDAAFTSVLAAYDAISTGGANEQLISGLDVNETYFFRVSAQTACGTSNYSAVASVTTDGLSGPPTNLSATPGCTDVTINWQPISGSVSRYEIFLDDDSNFDPTASRDAASTGGSVVISGLPEGTPYFYHVVAVLDGCETAVATSTTAFTTNSSPAPVGPITATDPTCDGFTTNWTAEVGGTYVVEASPASDNFADPLLITTSPELTEGTFVFTGLSTEETYRFRVISRSDCGTDVITDAPTSVATNTAAACVCGHDEVEFAIIADNETCPGSQDGDLFITARKKDGVVGTPDITRFEYMYESVTDPSMVSTWESGDGGLPPAYAHVFNNLPNGDYRVMIRDSRNPPDCDDVTINVTIGLQNEIGVSAKAETCDAPGEVVVSIPTNCADPSGLYALTSNGNVLIAGDDYVQNGNEFVISNLVSGDYEIQISAGFIDPVVYPTVSVFVPNTCSTGGEPSPECNLNGLIFLPETTLAACEDGQGSVTFLSLIDTDEEFTFTVARAGENDVVIDTQDGTTGITFDDLPVGKYTYGIFDALGQSCQGAFTVGTKSVVFSAAPSQAITCDDVVVGIDVVVDAETSLAAGPYEVFLTNQTDTLATANIPVGAFTTSFSDVPVGSIYDVVMKPAADDACITVEQVSTNPPGTIALGFTYELDSAACFLTRGSGSVTVRDIVVDDNEPFTAYLYQVDTGSPVEYASRVFSTTPQSILFEDIENGQYQVHLVQQQRGCTSTTQEKRSTTFTVDGPSSPLQASVRSFVEVTVNYPYGTIEIDSIGNLVAGSVEKEGAPYEVRIAADPAGDTTGWVLATNDNPLVRPYRYEYLDMPVGEYIIEIRDRFGCVVSYPVVVGYTNELYIPNIFTPNDDGQNDTFYILNLENFGEDSGVRMLITNRWGNKIYSSPNYTNEEAWDGEDYPDGVYFYQLVLPNQTEFTGWVEIWRGKTP